MNEQSAERVVISSITRSVQQNAQEYLRGKEAQAVRWLSSGIYRVFTGELSDALRHVRYAVDLLDQLVEEQQVTLEERMRG